MIEVQQQQYNFPLLNKLEQARQFAPACIRIVAALIQESVAEFVSPLLMIGLILSMTNFLMHGAIFSAWSGIPFIWALVQCVAIDANLGVMLVRSVRNLQQGEWIKGIIYLLISGALLFVAAVIFDVEAVQSVLDHSVSILIPIQALTLVRSIAIVALVATVQLESVSLKWQRRQRKAKIKQFPYQPDPTEPHTGPIHIVKREDRPDEGGAQPELLGTSISDEQAMKLHNAYQQLAEQGGKVSVNKLQRESKVRREVVSAWLEARNEAAKLSAQLA